MRSLPLRMRVIALSALAALFSCMLVMPRLLAQDSAVTVHLWHAYGESEGRGLEAAVHAFERTHPGIDVEVTAIPFGAYASKLEVAIPSGHGPDAFIDAHDRLATYVQAHVIAPFGPLSPELTSDITAAHLEALQWDGANYGVPLNAKSLVLFVNRALGDPDVFTTLESFQAWRGAEGIVPLAWEVESTYGSAALFHAYGAHFLDEDGHYALSSEQGAEALHHLSLLPQSGTVPEESSGELVRNLFRSGHALAAVSGPWLAPDLSEIDFAVRPLPHVEAANGAPLVPFATVEAFFLSARASESGRGTEAQRSEALHALGAYLASTEGARIRLNEGGHIVATRSAWSESSPQWQRACRDAAADALPMPTHPNMSRVFGPTDRAIRKVLRGEMDAPTALLEARHRFEDETRALPVERSPTFGFVIVSALLLVIVFALARQVSSGEQRLAIKRSMPAYAWVLHAFVIVLVLVVFPLVVGALTSFYAGHGRDLHYVGTANYEDILSARGGALFASGSFYVVLGVTVLWTVVNVALHVGIGVCLALLLSRPALHFKTAYRVLLVLPWAVPSYVTALAWRGMFHRQFGAVNAILSLFDVEPVSWFAQFSTAFTANVTTNVWLGFPFMMVVTLGALTSIPKDLYEAAEVDGATPFEQFRHITLPMLAPALLPAVMMGAVWTFNMFNVVFLVSAGEPDGTTEILVSEAYRWAFTRGQQTGYAAAYAVLIFGLLWLFSRWTSPKPARARASKEAT